MHSFGSTIPEEDTCKVDQNQIQNTASGSELERKKQQVLRDLLGGLHSINGMEVTTFSCLIHRRMIWREPLDRAPSCKLRTDQLLDPKPARKRGEL